jgi:hypothetical protein
MRSHRIGTGCAIFSPLLGVLLVLAICGPQTVFAAPRVVLCEEFTNLW